MKYIFWLFLLLSCNILLAQEGDLVIYKRSHGQVKIKKSGKKKIKSWEIVINDREAELIYSPNYLLFKSSQKIDTVFLSAINETVRDVLCGKLFYVSYNDNTDLMMFLFCNRKSAKNFKRFMLANGGQYQRYDFRQILLISCCTLLAPVLGCNPFESSLTPVWSQWKGTCDASKK